MSATCWLVRFVLTRSLAVFVSSAVPSTLSGFQSFYPRTGLRNMSWLIYVRETALSECSLSLLREWSEWRF